MADLAGSPAEITQAEHRASQLLIGDIILDPLDVSASLSYGRKRETNTHVELKRAQIPLQSCKVSCERLK